MKSKFLSTWINLLTFGRIKYGWFSAQFKSKEEPIVLGGCSRSGTTLMSALLNAHSKLFIALETALLTGNSDLAHLAGRTGLPKKKIAYLYRISHCSAEFSQIVLTTLMKQNNKLRWGDKSPVYVTVIDFIFEKFPKAHFIHLIRDGRDVVCSLRNHKPAFVKKPPSEKPIINDWSDCVDRWESWVRKGIAWREDPRYCEVKYESLVEQPESTLKGIFDWLGEPWEDGIFLKVLNTKVMTHPGVSKPINNSSIGRWKSDLPIDARKLFQGTGSELLKKLGYIENDNWIKDR